MCHVHLCTKSHGAQQKSSCFEKWHRYKDLCALSRDNTILAKPKPKKRRSSHKKRKSEEIIEDISENSSDQKRGSIVTEDGKRRSSRRKSDGHEQGDGVAM